MIQRQLNNNLREKEFSRLISHGRRGPARIATTSAQVDHRCEKSSRPWRNGIRSSIRGIISRRPERRTALCSFGFNQSGGESSENLARGTESLTVETRPRSRERYALGLRGPLYPLSPDHRALSARIRLGLIRSARFRT